MTRGLIGFRIGKKYKASFVAGDQSPQVHGLQIVQFIKEHLTDEDALAQLAAKAKRLTWVKPGAAVPAALQDRYSRYLPRKRKPDTWEKLFKHIQGPDILYPLLTRELEHLADATSLAADSAQCEWSYFFNFDDGTLEVWRGHQKQATDGNPFGTKAGKNGYYPIAMLDYSPIRACNGAFMARMESADVVPPVEVTLTTRLAWLILEYWEGDVWAGHAAWKRLMQNSLSLKAYKAMIGQYKPVGADKEQLEKGILLLVHECWDRDHYLSLPAWNRLMERQVDSATFLEMLGI